MNNIVTQFPRQQLSFSKKTKQWRKQCVDWADGKTFFNHNLIRKSVMHKKINYDLVNGKLHMEDLHLVLNPDNIEANFIPEQIQHYPIINSKLNVLKGEELKRVFDYKVIITNPNSISEIEQNKQAEMMQKLQQIVEDQSQNQQQYEQELQKLNDYFMYDWQDLREIRANCLLNHYVKELNMPLIFNQGFMDAMIVAEEIYQCDIVGGEPTIERVDPLKIKVFKSGYSNKIEDADLIIMEDYWSPGKIIDIYYDVLTQKDIDYIEKTPNSFDSPAKDSMDNIDDRYGMIDASMLGEKIDTGEGFYFDGGGLFSDMASGSLLPYDLAGNIRVLRVFWKSRRKIKKVRSFNVNTGEEEFNFYPENYVINEALGEEEEIFYINEAWEGTKIGENIYVNMRPRVVQYNKLSNPSRCHFGIIGSVYNLNNAKPFSLIDMMKPYNYLYDAIHDRLNKLLAKNWGKLIKLDLSEVPAGWDISKWLYYAKTNSIAVIDSFKEGNVGAATGKLAGALNNANRGVIDAELGNTIQSQINLLEYIKSEMAEVAGISKQREGQIASRETVGGVERATLQSSYITEWIFFVHEDVKRRALECFLETAKIALRGKNLKFQYLLPDSTLKALNIDGDEFAESDYGLLVDNSQSTQQLQQKLDMLAQAALQNQTLNFSTIMKLYSSCSLAEKQRLVERNEQELQQQQQQIQEQQMQQQQQQIQAQLEQKQADMQLQDQLNKRDNETKLTIAQMQVQNNTKDLDYTEVILNAQQEQAKLEEEKRQFDEQLDLDKQELAFNRQQAKEENLLERLKIAKQNTAKNNSKK